MAGERGAQRAAGGGRLDDVIDRIAAAEPIGSADSSGRDGHRRTGLLDHQWQVAPSSAWNGSWDSIGGNVKEIWVANNADGRMDVFAIGSDDAVYHQTQTAPNAPFNGDWYGLGGAVRP